MTAQADPYVKVYYRTLNDPKFMGMSLDVKGAWVDLLILADSMYPAPAPLPRWLPRRIQRDLVERGIVDLVDGDSFHIHGLAAERDKRSAAGNAGASARWSERNATAVRPQSDRIRTPDASPLHSTPLHSSPLPAGDADALSVWYDLKAGQISEGSTRFVRDLADQFGEERMVAAMREEAGATPVDREFLGRVKGRLVVASEKRSKAAEQRARRSELEYQRSLQEAIEAQTPEERERTARIKSGIDAFLKGAA